VASGSALQDGPSRCVPAVQDPMIAQHPIYRTRTGAEYRRIALNGGAPLDHPEQYNHDSDHDKDMDKSAEREGGDQPKEPEDDQDDSNGVKHLGSPLL